MRLGFPPFPAQVPGGAQFSEGLCWGSQALSKVLQRPHAPSLCLKANTKNDFCQGLNPAINCGDRYHVSNPRQILSARTEVQLTREKAGSTRVPAPPLRWQKGHGKTGTERAGLILTLLTGRMVFLAPLLPLKRDKAGPHPSHSPPHGREYHVEESQVCGGIAYSAF